MSRWMIAGTLKGGALFRHFCARRVTLLARTQPRLKISITTINLRNLLTPKELH